jgi:hypothetical protein
MKYRLIAFPLVAANNAAMGVMYAIFTRIAFCIANVVFVETLLFFKGAADTCGKMKWF